MSEKDFSIGQKIKTLRGRARWYQKQLADAVDVPERRISEWERNKTYPRESNIGILVSVFAEKLNTSNEEIEQFLRDSHKSTTNEHPPTEFQPQVSSAPVTEQLSHYSSRSLDILGRGEEQHRLNTFLNSKKPFTWLQIAGAGGQGKSRLAYELILNAEDEDWSAGFLTSDDLEAFTKFWQDWQPNKPHLLVFDYVEGREAEIGVAFRSIARRAEEFRLPVRILFLERQCWNQGYSSTNISNESEGRAEWFIKLSSRHDGNEPSIAQTRYENGLVELKQLDNTARIRIVRQIAEHYKTELEHSDEYILEQLDRIDDSGRPLYAYFLGQVLSQDPSHTDWTRYDLLDKVLEKDRNQRWNVVFERDKLDVEENPSVFLAALATMVGGLDCKELRPTSSSLSTTASTRYKAHSLLGSPIGTGSVSQFLPPLQPDILGEWFVLRMLDDGLPSETLCEFAWNINPSGVKTFLYRVAQDFPDHSATNELITYLPKDSTKDSHAKLAVDIIGKLRLLDKLIPSVFANSILEAADTGNDWAMNNIGVLYATGTAFEKDDTVAMEWFKKAADAGNSAAIHNIGVSYQTGRGVSKDHKSAVKWFSKAANAGHIGSMSELGVYYLRGKSIKRNLSLGIKWLKKGAKGGNSDAMENLGICYLNGDGVNKSPKLAIKWFREAAELGNTGAMRKIGNLYERGLGVEQDHALAFEWMAKSAASGNGEAMNDVGIYYQDGIGVEQNDLLAFKWVQMGAEAGDSEAMGNLGFYYLYGTGVDKNNTLAFKWSRKGAKANNNRAMCNLGFCYLNGIGVEKSNKLAFKWFQKSAKSGNSRAMSNLGSCYLNGAGVKKSNTLAFKWFRKGAKAGNSLAMTNLATCYHNGIGVKKNESLAAKWLADGIYTHLENPNDDIKVAHKIINDT